MSKKVWAFAWEDHGFAYLLDCLLLAFLHCSWRFVRCLVTWPTDYSQNAAFLVSFVHLRPRQHSTVDAQLLAYSTTSVNQYLSIRYFAT